MSPSIKICNCIFRSKSGCGFARRAERDLLGGGLHFPQHGERKLSAGETPNPDKNQSVWNSAVGPGFFQTMGIPILAGRDFNENDTATAPKVGILSESLARKAFPGQNPIGKRFLAHFHPREDTPGDLIEVVGICGDTRYWSLKRDPIGMFYQPYQQTPNLCFGATYEVRTSLSSASIAPSLRKAVHSIDRKRSRSEGNSLTILQAAIGISIETRPRRASKALASRPVQSRGGMIP